MGWPFWLMLALIIAILAALTNVKPSGTRRVAHTQLMGVARVVLILVAILALFAFYRAYHAG